MSAFTRSGRCAGRGGWSKLGGMNTFPRRALCAAALGLTLALAACGGDDDEAADSVATEAAAPAANEPLDAAAWAEYVEARDEARAVNDKAIATFRTCQDLLGTDVPVDRIKECLGNSTADVVSEGRELLAVLDGLAAQASGACQDAAEKLSGNVKLYVSSVNAIGLTVENSTLPTSQDIGSSLAQLETTRDAATEFDHACEPA